ncbi:MAG TPA: hypothetical protein VG028_11220 [Terriglobia bacterium]|nr:hypothetical protein [Terriglobia bacterium]
MLCRELERLESELIRIRSGRKNPALTDAEKDVLLDAEVQKVMDVKEHQSIGHNGERCRGE